MNRLGLTISMLIAASGTAAAAQPSSPSQGIEIPGDGDVPLEDRLTSVEVDRDLLFASGFDRRTARAHALLKAGRLNEAEELYRLVVTEELAAPDRDERFLAWAEANLGRLLAIRERDDAAELILRRAFARVEWRPDSERPLYQITCNLGSLLASQGRFAEAEPLLRKAVSEMSRRSFKGSIYSLHSQLGLAYALFAQEKHMELNPLLKSLETQITRFNFGGTDFDARLRRLQCLAAGTCKIGRAELWAEVSRAITPTTSEAS
jgi:tetratricopeptide (TPR) repeat protein